MATSAVPARAALRAGLIDESRIAAQMKRASQWRWTPDIAESPVSLEPIEIVATQESLRYHQLLELRNQVATFLATVSFHTLALVSIACVYVAPLEIKPKVLSLVADSSLLEQSTDDMIENLEAPIALITGDAYAPEQSYVATFASQEVDPGAMLAEATAIQFSNVNSSPVGASNSMKSASQNVGVGQASSGTGKSGGGGDPKGNVGAQFFGVQANGSRFVFVCDCSRSMSGEKWTRLQVELRECLDRLAPGKGFYLIFFDGQSHPMFAPASAEPELLDATPGNIERANQWMSLVPLGAHTSPFDSVRQALDLNPDAIFLLTDGEFRDQTAPYLRTHNREREKKGMKPIVVHTIGFFGEKRQLLLERIARDTGGIYRHIDHAEAERLRK